MRRRQQLRQHRRRRRRRRRIIIASILSVACSSLSFGLGLLVIFGASLREARFSKGKLAVERQPMAIQILFHI